MVVVRGGLSSFFRWKEEEEGRRGGIYMVSEVFCGCGFFLWVLRFLFV